MSLSATIAAIIENANHENPERAAFGLPVIFQGSTPRYIGQATSYETVDALLAQLDLSANRLSRAEVCGLRCYIAHA